MEDRIKEIVNHYQKEIDIINKMIEMNSNNEKYYQLKAQLLSCFDKVIQLTYEQM